MRIRFIHTCWIIDRDTHAVLKPAGASNQIADAVKKNRVRLVH